MTYSPGDSLDFTTSSVEELVIKIVKLHFADAIDWINQLSFDEAVRIFVHLPIDYAIELFDKPELHRAGKIIEALPAERAVALLNGMSADKATDVFQDMDAYAQQRLFVQLQPLTRAEIKKLTSYPEDSAGALMTTEFIAVPSSWTVRKTLDYIREVERTRETVYTIYIVDPLSSVLLSAISLRRLILAKAEDNVLEAAQNIAPITITAFINRTDVARLFRRYDLLSLPVVDDSNHVIGIVTVDDVLDAMTEDMNDAAHKFGGMEAIETPYMQTGFLEMLKKRSGWLCLLFLGETLTASAMQHFEYELHKAIMLTLFIPLIVSSGGNSGSQATSLIIRALALQEIRPSNWWKIIFKELPIGISLGAILGMIGFLRIVLWQYGGIYDYGEYWLLIAVTIFFALFAIVILGSLIGSMLPLILKAMHFDPASASAPFVATFVDVTGIIIYFSVAILVLSGSLL